MKIVRGVLTISGLDSLEVEEVVVALVVDERSPSLAVEDSASKEDHRHSRPSTVVSNRRAQPPGEDYATSLAVHPRVFHLSPY